MKTIEQLEEQLAQMEAIDVSRCAKLTEMHAENVRLDRELAAAEVLIEEQEKRNRDFRDKRTRLEAALDAKKERQNGSELQITGSYNARCNAARALMTSDRDLAAERKKVRGLLPPAPWWQFAHGGKVYHAWKMAEKTTDVVTLCGAPGHINMRRHLDYRWDRKCKKCEKLSIAAAKEGASHDED